VPNVKRNVIRFTAQAREDLDEIFVWTLLTFGDGALTRYERLIEQALEDLAANPLRAGSRERPEAGPGVRVYHLSSSRQRVASNRVKRPRHYIVFRVMPGSYIEVIRILHDERELVQRLS
jgi:toxin ParE1/3/4